jgi:hypothetical protein
MSWVLSFALFLLVIVIIYALVTGIAYKLQIITHSEARYRLIVALFLCISSVLLASIAAYFQISLLVLLLGLVLLTIVLGVIASIVIQGKTLNRQRPEQRAESAPPRQTARSGPQPKEAREEE